MKSNRLITLALAATLCSAGFTSCGDDYDDTAIKGQIEDLDQRVSTLEEKVKTEIAGIQAAISTLQGNDYVKAVKEVEGGYEITFSKGTVATIKNGKDGVKGDTPVLTAAKAEDDMFYWKVNGEWLMDGGQKVPASRTPEFTAATDVDGKAYWQIDGEWLLNEGQKVQATADAEPVKFDAEVSEDKSTITFTFGAEKYTVNVAKGQLEIADENEGRIIIGEATIYTVALPDGWTAEDLDVVRADVESAEATGLAITRAGSPAWTVVAEKTAEKGAKITVTGADITAGSVAELTVTFVKADGERLVGSTFLTAWVKDATPKDIAVSVGGEVATAIEGYPATHTVYTNITVSGSVAMNADDWAALKDYEALSALVISNTAASAVMPANAFENHPALASVDLTSSMFAAIPASAFAGCEKLTSFTGVAAITSIGTSAFEGCAALATVNTVNGVTTIGENAFKDCEVMASVTFGTLTAIGANAFNGCAALDAMPSLDNSITELPEGVFAGCAAINSATLANITAIGANAFANTGITTVTFPADVETIGENAFDGCAITAVTFSVAITSFTGFDEAAFAGITGATPTLDFASGQQNVDTVYSGTEWKGLLWTTVNVNGGEQTAPAPLG